MSWLVFAFSGPVLWAISTHLDKYLVEQYFKNSDVAVLLLFTAFIGVLLLPFIAFYNADVASPDIVSIALIMLAGILYMGALLFYLWALQSEEASVVRRFSKPRRCLAMRSPTSSSARRCRSGKWPVAS